MVKVSEDAEFPTLIQFFENNFRCIHSGLGKIF